jgi:hypothetical protein
MDYFKEHMVWPNIMFINGYEEESCDVLLFTNKDLRIKLKFCKVNPD